MQWSLLVLIVMGQCSSIGGQLCDYHFIGDKKTWKEAQDYCRENHTDLATVSNQTDMKRLHDAATAKYPQYQGGAWIGLKKNTPNIVWRWSLPGVEFNESESEWSPGQPDTKGCVNSRLDNCVRMNGGTWDDFFSSTTYKFICYDAQAGYLYGYLSCFHYKCAGTNHQLAYPPAA
ncbi:C-type lectin domain family 4 member F-like [Sander lucioperca]|uniref:C-type lectin domain family 4 member F-like n=1 Tax=Sander lucioperca TaxID=283035 RepID=UPI001653A079|nr:C-type lectin domain family 4 member F-like [Sander lucioperca]